MSEDVTETGSGRFFQDFRVASRKHVVKCQWFVVSSLLIVLTYYGMHTYVSFTSPLGIPPRIWSWSPGTQSGDWCARPGVCIDSQGVVLASNTKIAKHNRKMVETYGNCTYFLRVPTLEDNFGTWSTDDWWWNHPLEGDAPFSLKRRRRAVANGPYQKWRQLLSLEVEVVSMVNQKNCQAGGPKFRKHNKTHRSFEYN